MSSRRIVNESALKRICNDFCRYLSGYIFDVFVVTQYRLALQWLLNMQCILKITFSGIFVRLMFILRFCRTESGWDPAEIGDLLEDRFYNKIFKVEYCCIDMQKVVRWFIAVLFRRYCGN